MIGAILSRLRSAVVGTVESPGVAFDLIQAGYVEGSDRARGDLVKLGRSPGEAGRNLSGIHLNAVRVLYESLTDSLDGAISHVGRKANDVLRKATLREVLVSQLAGRDRGGTATALEENLRSRGVESFEDSRGTSWTLPRYAKMAAATTAHEASTTATLNRLAENNISLVKWHIGAGEKTCEVCKPYDRKVFSIAGSEADAGYPVLDTAPPVHPYCRCVLTGFVEGLSDRGGA